MRLTPRGGADRIDGVGPEGELRIRVAAAPVDGAANQALIGLLAQTLEIPRSALSVEVGQRGRNKRIHAEGVDPRALLERWPGLRVTPTTTRPSR